MILGFDHLALNVIDIDKQRQGKEFNTYINEVVCYHLPNPIEKKKYLKYYDDFHDVCLIKSKDKIKIEFTSHGNISGLFTPIQYRNGIIELYISELDTEYKFWTSAFKFKEVEKNILKFLSFIPDWSCSIKLVKNIRDEHYFLDCNGYSCIALLTNDIKSDKKIVENMGATDVTNVIDFKMKNKSMDIVFLRSPGGIICELIQIKKN